MASLRALHDSTMRAVRAYGKMSAEFDITTGVRHGDVLAPVLFNLFFDAVIAATLSEHPGAGMRMLYNPEGPLVWSRRKYGGEGNVQDLEYADDMALVRDSMEALEEMLRALNGLSVGIGANH